MSSSLAMLVISLLVLLTTAHALSATMTVNRFGKDGGPSACDGMYHSNNERIVAITNSWYVRGTRCDKLITIYANGKSTTAKVVDEYDSPAKVVEECDTNDGCGTSIIYASTAVWDVLGIYGEQRGLYPITWFDA